MTLFRTGLLNLHSGRASNVLIDCRSLTAEDLLTLAALVAKLAGPFRAVEGIPTGGLAIAERVRIHADPASDMHLIVDDVLTTGVSLLEAYRAAPKPCRAVVLFARGPLAYPWMKAVNIWPEELWDV